MGHAVYREAVQVGRRTAGGALEAKHDSQHKSEVPTVEEAVQRLVRAYRSLPAKHVDALALMSPRVGASNGCLAVLLDDLMQALDASP